VCCVLACPGTHHCASNLKVADKHTLVKWVHICVLLLLLSEFDYCMPEHMSILQVVVFGVVVLLYVVVPKSLYLEAD